MADQGVALVVGAGDGLGAALARRFAAEGFTVCVVRRDGRKAQALSQEIEAAGGRALGYAVDAAKEDHVRSLFEHIEADVGPLELVVFNAAKNRRAAITELTSQQYYDLWQRNAYAGFLVGREAARCMQPRGRGTLIFTGATASVRGASGFAAFAGAKAALRMLAQSMARELGPQGIHVAHVVVDGLIDTPFVREQLAGVIADKPDDSAVLNPDDIAGNYLHLHRQPRNAWTFELDLRPWAEQW